MHPYRTLSVPLNASSELIRQAYLEAIRRHPPERDPEAFRRIQQANSRIETEDLRIRRELGLTDASDEIFDSPREATTAFLQAEVDPEPPSEELFYQFLRS